MRNAKSTAELPAYLEQLHQDLECLQAKIQAIQGAQASTAISTAELSNLAKEQEKAQREWKARRRQCLDILDMISEGSGKSRATLMEEMGLEPDPA